MCEECRKQIAQLDPQIMADYREFIPEINALAEKMGTKLGSHLVSPVISDDATDEEIAKSADIIKTHQCFASLIAAVAFAAAQPDNSPEMIMGFKNVFDQSVMIGHYSVGAGEFRKHLH